MLRRITIYFILIVASFDGLSQEDRWMEKLYDGYKEISNSEFEKAIQITNEAFQLAKEDLDTYGMVMSKSVMGYIGMQVQDYASAYVNYTDALIYYDKIDTVDNRNKIDIVHNLAIIKSRFGDYKGSIALYKLAYRTAQDYITDNRQLATEDGDLDYLHILPIEMAMQMREDGQFENAGDIFVELWEESEFKKDTVVLAQVLNELGLMKLENKEYQKAQNFFGMVALNEKVNPRTRSIALHNLATSYKEQKDFKKAEDYYAQALNLKQELEYNDPRSEFITYLDRGELENDRGNTVAAINIWEEALATYENIDTDPKLFIVYDYLQKAYLEEDLEKSKSYGALYTSAIGNWMEDNNNQNSPELQVFNTRIDNILASRTLRAQRLQTIRKFWPYAAILLVIIIFGVYQLQLLWTRRRSVILDKNLKAVRASRADEILRQIRRD